MKNVKIEEVQYCKGDTGNEYYIACVYSVHAFKGRGIEVGAYSNIKDAYEAGEKWLNENKDFTDVVIRREELWCDSYEEALAIQYDGYAGVSSPIITIKQH